MRGKEQRPRKSEAFVSAGEVRGSYIDMYPAENLVEAILAKSNQPGRFMYRFYGKLSGLGKD